MVRVSGPRRSVAKLMKDTCRITRRQEQYSRGVMDTNTGKVVFDEPELIYQGVIFVAPYGLRQARNSEVGGVDAAQRSYQGSIPHDSPELRPGDQVEILTAQTDQQLVGKVFKVESITHTSVNVWRVFDMTDVETSRG